MIEIIDKNTISYSGFTWTVIEIGENVLHLHNEVFQGICIEASSETINELKAL
jgi:hypothetical protein